VTSGKNDIQSASENEERSDDHINASSLLVIAHRAVIIAFNIKSPFTSSSLANLSSLAISFFCRKRKTLAAAIKRTTTRMVPTGV